MKVWKKRWVVVRRPYVFVYRDERDPCERGLVNLGQVYTYVHRMPRREFNHTLLNLKKARLRDRILCSFFLKKDASKMLNKLGHIHKK